MSKILNRKGIKWTGEMSIIKGRRKLYMGIILGLTIITTSIILYFHPDRNSMVFAKGYFQLINNTKDEMVVYFSSSNGDKNIDNRDLMIDDSTLEKFVEFYGEKNYGDLQIYEREDTRYILESMGYNNTTKLKEYLEGDASPREKIYELLNSHLFEDQILKLDNMLN